MRIYLSVFISIMLLTLTNMAMAQTTCITSGQLTTCSDGLSYSHFGNITIGSDGSSYTYYGNNLQVIEPKNFVGERHAIPNYNVRRFRPDVGSGTLYPLRSRRY